MRKRPARGFPAQEAIISHLDTNKEDMISSEMCSHLLVTPKQAVLSSVLHKSSCDPKSTQESLLCKRLHVISSLGRNEN